MNEKIKELWFQCTNIETPHYCGEYEHLQKFAELIVRECLYEMENTSSGDLDFVIWKIKKDYGIEE